MVVVGPSGSGKTTVWSLLQAALNRSGMAVKHYVMNPKAMPRTQVRGGCGCGEGAGEGRGQVRGGGR